MGIQNCNNSLHIFYLKSIFMPNRNKFQNILQFSMIYLDNKKQFVYNFGSQTEMFEFMSC